TIRRISRSFRIAPVAGASAGRGQMGTRGHRSDARRFRGLLNAGRRRYFDGCNGVLIQQRGAIDDAGAATELSAEVDRLLAASAEREIALAHGVVVTETADCKRRRGHREEQHRKSQEADETSHQYLPFVSVEPPARGRNACESDAERRPALRKERLS